jgi:hypothetical protein
MRLTHLQPWPVGNNEEVCNFDYNELEPVQVDSVENSIQQQKVRCLRCTVSESDQLIMSATCQITFNKATKVERVLLKEEYPIGNHVQFSDKRVYRDMKTGFYFELNASRLGVWSAAMVCLSIHWHISNDF